eukprot:2518877-Pyramimonas_sp.AAC.1
MTIIVWCCFAIATAVGCEGTVPVLACDNIGVPLVPQPLLEYYEYRVRVPLLQTLCYSIVLRR